MAGCCENGNEVLSLIKCGWESSILSEELLVSHKAFFSCVGLVTFFFIKWANLSAIKYFSRVRY